MSFTPCLFLLNELNHCDEPFRCCVAPPVLFHQTLGQTLPTVVVVALPAPCAMSTMNG
jgi:hypothetical protein